MAGQGGGLKIILDAKIDESYPSSHAEGFSVTIILSSTCWPVYSMLLILAAAICFSFVLFSVGSVT